MSPGLSAQVASLALSSAAGAPGTAVSLNLDLTAPASAPPSALQFTLPYPATLLGPISFTAGPVLTAAGKTLTCVAGTASVTCLASGINANPIANGIVAVATVPILSTAGASSVPLAPAGVVAALPTATAEPITGTGGTITIQLPLPVTVSAVSVSPSSVTGGANLSVTVTLSGPSRSAGASVALTSSNAAVVPAATVTVPSGATSQTFAIATHTVSTPANLTVTASYNGSAATSASFTVNPPPPTVSSVSVSPASVAGGANLSVTVTLSGAAPSPGASVALTSSNAAVVPAATVTVSSGATSQIFTIATHTVSTPATLTVTASYNGSAATSTSFTVNPPPPTVSSVSVSPVSVTGGANLSVTVTLSGAAPSAGASVALTSSNAAVVPATTVTVSSGAASQTFAIATNAVSTAANLTVTASYSGSAATSASFTVNPPASQPPTGTASFTGADPTTQGWWTTAYGGDGFNVIGSAVSYPSYVAVTPFGAAAFTWTASTSDPRALQNSPTGPGRIAACWYNAAPFTIDLNFTDGNTHRVALYLLDWENAGRSETLSLSDANGKSLDTRAVSQFSGGQYLVWNLSGHVVVRVSNNAANTNAVVGGLFFGGAATSAPPPPSGTAQFLTTDAATSGFWKSAYGADGFNVIDDTADYPSYATVTPAGNSAFAWASSTSDPRALQKAASSTDRIAACWYAPSFSLDLAFHDSAVHKVALYLLDFDSAGRSEIVQVQDAAGNLLDTRSASAFSNGQYLVWNLSGHVVLKIASAAGSNAVVSGIFFGSVSAPSSSASFVHADTATAGSWHGVYGADGFNVIGDTAGYPSYVTVSPAGNAAFVWAASTGDLRALQKVATGSDRIAACWYGGSFTIDLAFHDNLPHQVALYLLDFDAAGRAETVQVLDGGGNLLDTRSVSGFSSGQYLVWNLTGHVVLSIARTAGANAVVSGIFFR